MVIIFVIYIILGILFFEIYEEYAKESIPIEDIDYSLVSIAASGWPITFPIFLIYLYINEHRQIN